MYEPDELPISEALRRDLQTWSDWMTMAQEIKPGTHASDWRPPPEDEIDDWRATGQELAQRLQTELGTSIIVTYDPLS